ENGQQFERTISDDEIANMTPSQSKAMVRDKVAIAISMLKTTYHPDDINRMCKEFGIHRDTAKRILSKLYQQATMLAG
ncbi:KilA-N domain-containing protein, partial [Acinetobacter baumannii]|nr:KilA-N domain-containing protein [Acinetobacter baumannii]